MAVNSIYRIPQPRGYDKGTFYIQDSSETSPLYFDVTSFPSMLGGGRSVITLKGGPNLRLNSTIDVEVLDAAGNGIYAEVTNFIDRFNNYYISIDIYDITAKGPATMYLVGEALLDPNGDPIPREQQNKYNVRWSRDFMVEPFERNDTLLLFDKPPLVSVAQIITPARLQTQYTSSGFVYTTKTSSIRQLTIETSQFKGYDRDFSTSSDILDPRLKGIIIDPAAKPFTENSVNTALRQRDSDIVGGYLIQYTNRYNTVITATSSFFKKEHLGGQFAFFNSQSVPKRLSPQLPAGVTLVDSLGSQLQYYTASIVEIINDKQAVISNPLTVRTHVASSSSLSTNRNSTFTYKKASNFTGSVVYAPSDISYATSSAVSQSYVEFTYQDLNPISGQVYRIKTYTKLESLSGEYKLLNDQIIKSPEYLTDAAFPNTTNYGKHESDYLLIGHFTTQSILDTYWSFVEEVPNLFTLVSGSVTDNPLIESAVLPASYTQSMVLTPTYNQNYIGDQLYTLGFYLTLDPYTELEVYMNSDPLNSYTILPQVYPKAFRKTTNNEKERYAGVENKFGKYVGKIVNDRPIAKYYGKVLFDFQTDADGLGRPLFRSRVVDEQPNTTGNTYVSEISIKPYQLNGFTPKLIQFPVQLSAEVAEAMTISQSIDFKIEYFDYTGKQSEYVTYLDDVVVNLKAEIPGNGCQAEILNSFTYDSSAVSKKKTI
jgi:hypothetical protein